MTDRTEGKPPYGGQQHKRASGGRDDRLDDDLNRQRLEPGLSSGGKGEAGADPAKPRSDGNSNT